MVPEVTSFHSLSSTEVAVTILLGTDSAYISAEVQSSSNCYTSENIMSLSLVLSHLPLVECSNKRKIGLKDPQRSENCF